MNYRFFKSSDAEVLSEIGKIIEHNNEVVKQLMVIRDEIGAESMIGNRSGSVSGFIFKEPPCSKVWRKSKIDGYMPKKNSKLGKSIYDRISQLKRIDINYTLECEAIGLPSSSYCLLEGNRAYSATCGLKDGVFYAKIPWREVEAAEIKQYKEDRDNGTRWCSEMSYLSWNKPECLIELKEWEFLRDLDGAGK